MHMQTFILFRHFNVCNTLIFSAIYNICVIVEYHHLTVGYMTLSEILIDIMICLVTDCYNGYITLRD